MGRVPTISVNSRQPELYYLRMLPHHVHGAKSFIDLKVRVEDDTEADRVMEKIVGVQLDSELFEVVPAILVYATLAKPENFWLKWKAL